MEFDQESIFFSRHLPNHSFRLFVDMRKKREFCDVTFKLGKLSLPAHKVIVSAAIPRLREELLRKAEEGGEQQLPLTGIDESAFESLIEYAYTSKIKITSENVKTILFGACSLNVDEVKNACCDFLTNNLSPENALDIRDFGKIVEFPELILIADHYVKEHFEKISKTKSFICLPFEDLKVLISSDNLQVKYEETVFEAVIQWIQKTAEREEHTEKLMRCVRMPLIDKSYFRRQINDAQLVKNSLKESCSWLDEVKDYHLYPEHRKELCSFSDKPRCFTKNNRIYKLQVISAYTMQYFESPKNTWSTCKHTFEFYPAPLVRSGDEMYFFIAGRMTAYNPSTDSYHTSESVTSARYWFGIVAHDNQIYICGGSDGSSVLNTVDVFDCVSEDWTKGNSMTANRKAPAVVSVGHFIYVIGGRNKYSALNSAERYNSNTGQWETIEPMLTGRYCLGAAVLNGLIYVCGGKTSLHGNRCVSTVEVYDPVTNQWEYIKSMNKARCKHILLPYPDEIYVLGGEDEKDNELHSVEIFDTRTHVWRSGETATDLNFFISGGSAMPIPEKHKRVS